MRQRYRQRIEGYHGGLTWVLIEGRKMLQLPVLVLICMAHNRSRQANIIVAFRLSNHARTIPKLPVWHFARSMRQTPNRQAPHLQLWTHFPSPEPDSGLVFVRTAGGPKLSSLYCLSPEPPTVKTFRRSSRLRVGAPEGMLRGCRCCDRRTGSVHVHARYTAYIQRCTYIYIYIYLYISISISISVSLSIYLSIYLFIYLSICI